MSAKDLQHPLKRARGLGSAQSGVGHWWNERVTSVALVALGVWFVVLVLRLMHADYAAAHALMARPWNAVLMICFLLVTFWHTALGLQVVIEDYVHTRWKEVSLLMLVKFFAVLGALASVLAVLRIVLGA
ncbi:succinate dehydrogenase, hydrophobic membrane anchor protein [Dyella sp.]|jgi:succinate dehydrogenase / fumarate reductase membrane anchor subunit|uniref:succinate dehydrogenase, hydrophobic membrane anchor protein n=1 Tax=Dyella sp. TaxID=1869338 RepID=UPI002D7832D0|nr:succinate dehydrogenase, hydrophobic membrane anchor protein [Dyella sp.]HET6432451.1 succinate dehydrogenase, hydrophobic membrane anchor protein [Dyella sp.]